MSNQQLRKFNKNHPNKDECYTENLLEDKGKGQSFGRHFRSVVRGDPAGWIRTGGSLREGQQAPGRGELTHLPLADGASLAASRFLHPLSREAVCLILASRRSFGKENTPQCLIGHAHGDFMEQTQA